MTSLNTNSFNRVVLDQVSSRIDDLGEDIERMAGYESHVFQDLEGQFTAESEANFNLFAQKWGVRSILSGDLTGEIEQNIFSNDSDGNEYAYLSLLNRTVGYWLTVTDDFYGKIAYVASLHGVTLQEELLRAFGHKDGNESNLHFPLSTGSVMLYAFQKSGQHPSIAVALHTMAASLYDVQYAIRSVWEAVSTSLLLTQHPARFPNLINQSELQTLSDESDVGGENSRRLDMKVKVLLAYQSGILDGTFNHLPMEKQYDILALLFDKSRGNIKNTITALSGNAKSDWNPMNITSVVERVNDLIREKELGIVPSKIRQER